MIATVEGGRVTHLRGDPDHPVTRGFLCYRTDHFLERQYSSERLHTPLIRKDGELREATWDEALDLIASKLAEARDRYGAETILHYQSGGSLGMVKQLNRLLFEALGSCTHKTGDICSGAGDAAQMADMGQEDAHDIADVDNSRAIILWGKNVAETGVHLIPHLKHARARGVPIIQIDPVKSKKTLALCDRHYDVRPGGDGFLALGVARALFDAGLTDPGAPSYCDGFDAFRALVERHSVAGWAELAGVPVTTVHEVAEVYGKNKPAALFVGWGLGRRLDGSATTRVLDALGAITGNLGVAGGGVAYSWHRRSGFDLSIVERPENRNGRRFSEPLLGEEILRADPKIKVAIIDNGNPVSQLPDSNTVVRALRSIDFLVVIDSFLTDTAELATVVLPSTTMLEEHDVVAAYGHHYVQLATPVAQPTGSRSDFEIYQALADRLGVGAALAGSTESWIDRLIAPMANGGITRERLQNGGLRKPHVPRVLFEGRRFATPTGRFQLLSDFPREPRPMNPAFPLHLMSISTYKNQSSQIAAKDQAAPAVVTLHPDAAPGFREGDRARLTSTIASVEVTLHFDDSQRRDLVVFPKGRWAKYGGPNVLIRARETDAGGGAAYYDEGVRVERC